MKKRLPSSSILKEFSNADEWILSCILVSVMTVNPEMTSYDAIDEAKRWMRGLYAPRTNLAWRKQATQISIRGIDVVGKRIRAELLNLIRKND